MRNIIDTGNRIVDELGTMNISGNVIPNNWYSWIIKDNGKPHLLAITLLSEIVYWYRPREIRDEQTGLTIGYQKKFKGDMLQKSYAKLGNKFGESKYTVKRAMDLLEDMGLIKKHIKDICVGEHIIPNALYIELVPERLYEITYVENINAAIEEEIEDEFEEYYEDTLNGSASNDKEVVNEGVQDKSIGGTSKFANTSPQICKDYPSKIANTSQQICEYPPSKSAMTYTKNTNTEITKENTTTELTSSFDTSVVDQATEILKNLSLTERDILAIIKAADGDINKIQHIRALLDSQTSKINNVTGWMINAIRNDYHLTAKNPIVARTQTSFSNFSERKMSTEETIEFERKILGLG